MRITITLTPRSDRLLTILSRITKAPRATLCAHALESGLEITFSELGAQVDNARAELTIAAPTPPKASKQLELPNVINSSSPPPSAASAAPTPLELLSPQEETETEAIDAVVERALASREAALIAEALEPPPISARDTEPPSNDSSQDDWEEPEEDIFDAFGSDFDTPEPGEDDVDDVEADA